jgi:hypothetical protein
VKYFIIEYCQRKAEERNKEFNSVLLNGILLYKYLLLVFETVARIMKFPVNLNKTDRTLTSH